MIQQRARFANAIWWIVALGLMSLSFALRVHDLGRPNLTNDEWFMLRNHDEGLLWIVHQAHTFEPHPLLYYLGLAGWIEVAGRTEFAMRFSSVVCGVLLTAGLIGLGRAIVGPRMGLIAGALVTLNPYQIAEAQNARNYAMVVALSAIASLLFLRAIRTRRWRDWIGYGVATLLALNTHLDAALILAVHVAFVAVLSLVSVGKCHRWARLVSWSDAPTALPLRQWFLTTVVVGALFAAWLLYAWPALVAYHGYFPEQVTAEKVLARSLATFSLGAATPVRQAWPAFLLAVLGIGWLALRRQASAAFVSLYVGLPVAVVSLLFLFRPMFDERYLIVLAPGYLLMLAAGLEALWSRVTLVGIAASAATAIVLYPTIPRTYQSMLTDRGDYRGMASWIATYGSPLDPIVATGYGQAELFGYYYRGPQKVQVLDQPSQLSTEIPSLLREHDGLWLLPYWQSPVDDAALGVLDGAAAPVAERWFVNVRSLYYASSRRLGRSSPDRATWDDRISLDKSSITSGEIAPGQAAAVELHWKVTDSLDTPKLSLRLLDSTGATVAQSDVVLSPAPHLQPGDATSRIGVLVPPVAPPGRYTLAILLYRPDTGATLHLQSDSPRSGDSFVLGSIQVGTRQQPVPMSETGVTPIDPVRFPGGLTVLGHDTLGPPRAAGSRLSFRVLWVADRSSLPVLDRTLVLRGDDGATIPLTRGAVLPDYPTSRWSAGEMLVERIECQIPATAAGGRYRLLLTVGSAASPAADLGEVDVSGPDRSYERPTVQRAVDARFGSFATLLGDHVDAATVQNGQPIALTLYWEARATADRSYTVFVHLVDATGKIRGQVDRPPLDGSRPTDGWVQGEFLADVYRVALGPDAPPGPYQIDVGFYDPATGARVPVVQRDGTTSDHLAVGTFSVAERQ